MHKKLSDDHIERSVYKSNEQFNQIILKLNKSIFTNYFLQNHLKILKNIQHYGIAEWTIIK